MRLSALQANAVFLVAIAALIVAIGSDRLSGQSEESAALQLSRLISGQPELDASGHLSNQPSSHRLERESSNPFHQDQPITERIASENVSNVIADAVETVRPAVVKITTRHVSDQAGIVQPGVRQPEASYPTNSPDISANVQNISPASGSGIIIDTEGFILTNAHVVNGATEVTVTLWNGEHILGHVLGQNRRLDVALIHAEASSLKSAPMGDSDQIRPG